MSGSQILPPVEQIAAEAVGHASHAVNEWQRMLETLYGIAAVTFDDECTDKEARVLVAELLQIGLVETR